MPEPKSNDPPINWDELAQSIADGEAVLVLGPDAIPFYPAQGGGESRSFSDLARERILENLNGQISHFYQRDNLYQFSGRGAKHEAMKCVREVASDTNWLADSELLRQIVAIPFPVVLSVNPDKCLWQAFAQHYREPQFDYFTAKDKPAQVEIAYPDGLNRPLIYNLCGSVLDKRDSVVLDYFDLFEMLKNVLADQGIPKALTDKLKDSDRFILLGFELDRWYFQLFLHYLNRLDENPFNDNPNQNFPILSRVSEDARQFVMNQFNIRHIAASRDEFDALYAACERRGILRKLNDPRSPVETQIRMLTAQGKYEEAFDLLEKHLDAAEKSIDLPHLRARYADWLRQKNEGIADSRDLATEQNRIRYALLTFANQIPQQP